MGGTAQSVTTDSTNDDKFTVDQKVIATTTKVSDVTGAPNTAAATSFMVSNPSNSAIFSKLTAA